MPRVLVLVENLSVPFDRRVWQECTTLVAAGWDVDVICPMGTNQDREPVEERNGVRIFRYPLRAATGGAFTYLVEYPTAMWRTLRLAHRLARQDRFDVVHACNPPDLFFLVGLSLRVRHRTKFLFDHHDLVPELYLSRFGAKRGLVYRATLLLERLTFRTASVVLSTNESYRRVAIDRGRKPPDRVFVVRSAPDLSRFDTGAAPDDDLRRGKRHLACYLGVMGPQDGVDYALRALAHVRFERARDDLHTIFIGAGDALDACRQLTRELGLADVVEFTGRIPDADVVRHLATADVCLSPDPQNPLNDVSTMNKVMEYMAMGRPIVSFELTEARVSAGDAAVYAPANDHRAFGDLIVELLDDPDRRARMGELGRARVEELSWDRSAEALRRAYAAVLDQ